MAKKPRLQAGQHESSTTAHPTLRRKPGASGGGGAARIRTCLPREGPYAAPAGCWRTGGPAASLPRTGGRAPLTDAQRLAEAVLLFHRGGHWTLGDRRRWLQLTGSADCTSKALCNLARAVQAGTAPIPELNWQRDPLHPDTYACKDTEGNTMARVEGRYRDWRFLVTASPHTWSKSLPSARTAMRKAEAALVAERTK